MVPIESNDRLYGNILFLSPDGKEMFRSNLKKANWYLSRDLVKIVSNDPLVIQFIFKPNGNGHDGDVYYLSEKSNSCVVCNSTHKLTKHHTVPYEFRKLFPNKIKEYACHDVVLLCEECHDKYNKISADMYRQLKQEVGINKKKDDEKYASKFKAIRAAITLLIYRNDIPNNRILELTETIKNYTKKEVTNRMIERVSKIKHKPDLNVVIDKSTTYKNPFALAIVKKYGPEELSNLWRKHFINSMNPKFLPTGWNSEKQPPYGWDVKNSHKTKDEFDLHTFNQNEGMENDIQS